VGALAGRLGGEETVLLKASRGVALERLLPRFEERWGLLHPHGEAFRVAGERSSTGSRDDARPAERPQRETTGTRPAARTAERRGD
jgi:hypothetical protein